MNDKDSQNQVLERLYNFVYSGKLVVSDYDKNFYRKKCLGIIDSIRFDFPNKEKVRNLIEKKEFSEAIKLIKYL